MFTYALMNSKVTSSLRFSVIDRSDAAGVQITHRVLPREHTRIRPTMVRRTTR
jgi:hypothetical protein